MRSETMKSLLVHALCFFPLLGEGAAAALAPYSRKIESLEHLQQHSGNENGTVECDEASRSVMIRTDVQHRWTIEDFRDQEALQKLTSFRIQSAEFASPDKKYRFRISFENSRCNGYGYSDRTLRLHSLTDYDSLSCKVRFDIVLATNGSSRSVLEKVIYLRNTAGARQIAEVTPFYDMERYAENDTLVILCHVTIYDRALTTCDTASPSARQNTKAFVDSFKKLLESKTGNDLDVKANGCVIPAHKSILLARSPVMESLIEENGQRSLLNATQFSCGTMNCVVSYVYTNNCTSISDTAEQVLLAALVYQLPGLKQLAETQLILSLDEKNIVSRAKLAKEVRSTTLIRGVTNYIIRNRHVLNLDAWKKLEMEESGPTGLILREIILRA